MTKAQWLTVRQAARLLNVSTNTVSYYHKRGLLATRQLKPGKQGSRVWVLRLSVETLKERMNPNYQPKVQERVVGASEAQE